jgi:hypothetical protein
MTALFWTSGCALHGDPSHRQDQTAVHNDDSISNNFFLWRRQQSNPLRSNCPRQLQIGLHARTTMAAMRGFSLRPKRAIES